MKGTLALFALGLWLIWFFYRDGKQRAAVSSSAWLAVIWLFIHGTRSISAWIGWENQYSRDEGNPLEATFNFILIVAALTVVIGRRPHWRELIQGNKWFLVIYLFWFTSILWSDDPVITFKRLFKEIGNVFMLLIILTDKNPSETVRAVCVRFAYICIPLSVILIKYYPQWGRTFVGYHKDVLMYTGVTTQKNMLGVIVLVSAVFLFWDILEQREKKGHVTNKPIYISNVLVLFMCWYLLLLIDSATSLVCAVVGTLLFVVLGHASVRKNPVRMEVLGFSAVIIVALLDTVFDIRKAFIESLGRNMTLTTRTEIWEIVRDYQDNVLVGQGFETFWSGERLQALADKTFGIIQAHNGYLETYLNGGLLGLGLLAALLISGYTRLRKKLRTGNREDRIRFTTLLTAIVYNYTEASFFKLGALWFVTCFAIVDYRRRLPKSVHSDPKNRGPEKLAVESIMGVRGLTIGTSVSSPKGYLKA